MIRICLSLAALGAAVALAGCNETTGGAMAGPLVGAPPSPVAMSLPPGAACTNEIDRYETVVKSDLGTGNLEEKVYSQIQIELARAASACSAGRNGEAHSIVTASKDRHGYRA